MNEEPKDLRDAITRTVEFGQKLSTEIMTDLALGKWNLRDNMTLKQKYAEEIHEKYPQIAVESVLRLLFIGVDPGVEHATMSIGGKMFSITPELKEGDNLFDHLAPDDGSYGLSYFSNPDRSDITMDWSGTFLDPKRRIGGGFSRGELALVVAGSPYQPMSDRMLANKHQTFWDEEYAGPSAAERAALYHQKKLINNGFHGATRLRGIGGHVDLEHDGFLPRDYQQPLIYSALDGMYRMGKRTRAMGARFSGDGTAKIQNASFSGMKLRNMVSDGHLGWPMPVEQYRSYMRMNALTRRLGFTHVKTDPVITLRYSREYGHGYCTVIAPVNAGEFYKSPLPHYYNPAFAIDIETNIASRALLPKVTTRNKGPKKRRHK
jgi:hypothetical protein